MAASHQPVNTAELHKGKNPDFFVPETNASLDQLKRQSPDPLTMDRTESLMRRLQEYKLPIDQTYSLEEVREWLNQRWEYIDLDEWGVKWSDQERFRESAAQAIMEINAFLYQAERYPGIQIPQSSEYIEKFFSDIENNIEHIWKDNLGESWSRNIEIADFSHTLFYAEMQYARNNPEELEKVRQKFLSDPSKTQSDWVALMHNDVYEKHIQRVQKEQVQNTRYAQLNQSLQSKSLFGVTPDTLKMDGQETVDDYANAVAHWVVNDSADGGEFGYLGNGGEPFYEVIQFLQRDGTGTISPEAYKAMQSMLKGESRREKHSTWVQNKIDRSKKYYSDSEKHEKYSALNKKIALSDHTYQLAMYQIAKAAQAKMGKDANHASFIEGVIDPQDALVLKNQAFVDGYEVKNRHADSADGSIEAQYAGRLTFENLLLDQVIRSAGLLMVIANVMVGFRSGNWGAVAPYIAAGGAVTYGLAQGVLNSGIDKMRYPEKMLENITKESFGNTHYPVYFGNEWEIALVQSLSWPEGKSEQKEMKDSMKGIRDEKNKKLKTIDDPTAPNGKRDLGKFPFTPDKKIRDRFTKNIEVEEFQQKNENEEEGSLARYLKGDSFLGPDGQMYTREAFLQKVKENGVGGDVRYEMMTKTVSRIGSKSSYLPYLNQLHHYYSVHYQNKKVGENLAKLESKVHGHGG